MKRWLSVFTAICSVLVLGAVPAMAGNLGDFYDNRDDNHAAITTTAWPEVVKISTGYGYQYYAIKDSVVVGNASLAYTSGATWSSLGRYSYMTSSGAQNAYRQYRSNNMYWHPEHRDHDTVDFYHGMSPCFGTSQGSSGSETDELRKWFDALDGFKPAVKNILRSQGLLMPVIQMLSRRTRMVSDSAYLTGAAHPNAFDNANNQAAMKAMAAAIDTHTIPPFAALRVREENYTGSDTKKHFGVYTAERYWDTPASVARIFLGREYRKRVVLNADSSFDVNRRTLTYHWRVLRGAPGQVIITPLKGDNSEVEVSINYHPLAVIDSTGRKSNLAVVGLFVHNGHYFSPPAFFTSYTLNNEQRTYHTATGAILKVTYNKNYVFPNLAASRSWDADTFSYDSTGCLTGWRRTQADSVWEFVAEGYLVREKDTGGRVTKVQDVVYTGYSSAISWYTTGNVFNYQPASLADGKNQGSARPARNSMPYCTVVKVAGGQLMLPPEMRRCPELMVMDITGKEIAAIRENSLISCSGPDGVYVLKMK
jgi:hypothetical protein